MATEAHPVTITHVRALSRLRGFGSVYGRALHDARPAVAAVAGGLSVLLALFGMYFADTYATAGARVQLLDMVRGLPPVLTAFAYGTANPVGLDTLGGYLSHDVGLFLKLVPGLWSILALSGTVAAEARSGSLEFVAAAPLTRRRLALQKVAAHVTAMVVAVTVVAAVTWLTGQAFAQLPADAIPAGASAGYGLWLGLIGLLAGAIAFAMTPLLGQAAATGIAGAVLFGGYVVSAYQGSFPAFSGVARLTWFSWTADHIPLAGGHDWSSLAAVALATIACLAVGVEAFARHDLTVGARGRAGAPRLPGIVAGLRGPFHRALGDLLPPALGWGLGIGAYGLLVAASSRPLAEQLGSTPDIAATLRGMFPDTDITSVGGVMEASFMLFAYILAGLAGASLVRVWATDETSGRLELLLTSPLTRARWVVWGGLGVHAALTVATLIVAGGVGIGAALAGAEVAGPMTGALALGLYAAGLAGVGLAVGGLVGTALARPVVIALAVAIFVTDVLGTALELPAWTSRLALSAQLGQPMAGTWNLTGMAACLVLAAGGVAVGAWGMRRRDVQRS